MSILSNAKKSFLTQAAAAKADLDKIDFNKAVETIAYHATSLTESFKEGAQRALEEKAQAKNQAVNKTEEKKEETAEHPGENKDVPNNKYAL
jgi:Tfp pilus assembly protein PilP